MLLICFSFPLPLDYNKIRLQLYFCISSYIYVIFNSKRKIPCTQLSIELLSLNSSQHILLNNWGENATFSWGKFSKDRMKREFEWEEIENPIRGGEFET